MYEVGDALTFDDGEKYLIIKTIQHDGVTYYLFINVNYEDDFFFGFVHDGDILNVTDDTLLKELASKIMKD